MLINRLPETSDGEPLQETPELPGELNTDRARKCFRKAVENGFMVIDDGRYKWKDETRGSRAKLAYFCEQVYCHNRIIGTLPEQALNWYFNVNRLGSAISALYDAKKPQAWRSKIDICFIE